MKGSPPRVGWSPLDPGPALRTVPRPGPPGCPKRSNHPPSGARPGPGSSWRRWCETRSFRGEGVTDGRGQPVLLIPGFLAGDDSLRVMGALAPGHRPPPQPGGHPGQRGLLGGGDRPPGAAPRVGWSSARAGARRSSGTAAAGSFAQGACPAPARPGVGDRDRWAARSSTRSPIHPLVRAQIEARRRPRAASALPGLFSRGVPGGRLLHRPSGTTC